MKKILLVCIASIVSIHLHATHLRSGEIKVMRLDCSSFTYQITVAVYLDTTSPVQFGGSAGDQVDILNFGDGTSMIVPSTATIARPDLGPNVGYASFTTTHTYNRPGKYLVSYIEPNRSPNVLNMANSVYTTFYTETLIVIDPLAEGCNSGIDFLTPPIFTLVSGATNSLSLSATTKDGLRLRYSLVPCNRDRFTEVSSYVLPSNAAIDENTGLFTWDGFFQNSYVLGEFNFAVKVELFDENEFKGYTIRDFQIIVVGDAFNGIIKDTTTLNEYNRIYVPNASNKSVTVFAQVSNNYTPSLEIFSEVPEFVNLVSRDSTHENTKIKVGKITFNNPGTANRNIPYVVTVRSKFSGKPSTYVQDQNYLFFTEDVFLPILEIVTSLDENMIENKYIVYPNPVNDVLQFATEGSFTYTILNPNGSVVLKGRCTGSLSTVNLIAGLYILVINDESSSRPVISRFIKY